MPFQDAGEQKGRQQRCADRPQGCGPAAIFDGGAENDGPAQLSDGVRLHDEAERKRREVRMRSRRRAALDGERMQHARGQRKCDAREPCGVRR